MRRRRAALALLCMLVLPVVAACSAQPAPLCDQAAKLVEGRHLGAALSRYVDAERAGEGGCAVDGQDDVEDRQSKVALVVAQAASAERRGDVKGAGDLYVQALTQDVDNAPARSGLARLQASQSGGVDCTTLAGGLQSFVKHPGRNLNGSSAKNGSMRAGS